MVPLLNELLARICNVQRFVRQFGRRGWVRFVTHSRQVTAEFQRLEQEVAAVYTRHLSHQLPALLGIVRNMAVRNVYTDGGCLAPPRPLHVWRCAGGVRPRAVLQCYT